MQNWNIFKTNFTINNKQVVSESKRYADYVNIGFLTGQKGDLK